MTDKAQTTPITFGCNQCGAIGTQHCGANRCTLPRKEIMQPEDPTYLENWHEDADMEAR